ncbi:MAG: carboxypeptidase-like regulatory domain-containing protein [Microscillaceae bacterium]|nr:carboxypeptidase-like regulatory domain-containing protein [Microscillaceae bacterium]MDW8461053.1 carboxypeptidase-like regulatory domain-containing protein [Cytophagales bacterium]
MRKTLTLCLSSFLLLWLLGADALLAQVTGTVTDEKGNPLVGVSIVVEGTFIGTTTDSKGNFSLKPDFSKGSVTLVFSYVGYQTQKQTVSDGQNLTVQLAEANLIGDEIIVSASRIEENVLRTPVTVEKIGIKELEIAPSTELFSSFSRFKGIDVNQSSLLLSSVSTRGFNSAKSERIIQLVDYVDIVSPSLSLYAGNMLGPIELDLESVDIIYGANSALYGSNAFNGVILQNTKDPFTYEGLAASLKVGTRNLFDAQIRYAQKFMNNKLAVKFNASYMMANEFIGANYDAINREVISSPPLNGVRLAGADPLNNPFGSPLGYNAVNRYGDLGTTITALAPLNGGTAPRVYTPGFTEKELIMVGTKEDHFRLLDNDRFNAGFWRINPSVHYLINEKTKATLEYKTARGNGIYQSSNRYAWRNIVSDVIRAEVRSDKWFVRAYTTRDTGGNTYDLGFLGNALQQTPIAEGEVIPGSNMRYPSYIQNYFTLWASAFTVARTTGAPAGAPIPNVFNPHVLGPDGKPVQFTLPFAIPNLSGGDPNSILQAQALASQIAAIVQLQPGSAEFNRLRNLIANGVGNLNVNGALEPLRTFGTPATAPALPLIIKGAAFTNASRLIDLSAQYDFKNIANSGVDFIIGGSGRLFNLTSNGTLFSDGDNSPLRDGNSNDINRRDNIQNWEFGIYAQAQKSFFDNRLRLAAAARNDNFKNFGSRLSPRISAVLSLGENRQHNIRTSYAVAFRAPTQVDQYIYLDIGPILLRGNVENGYSAITGNATPADLVTFANTGALPANSTASLTKIKKLDLERMSTWEIGYKGNLFKGFYLDASYYYSQYQNFIGTSRFFAREDGRELTKEDFDASPTNPFAPFKNPNDRTRARFMQAWVNSDAIVFSQGAQFGFEYFITKPFNLTANYTYAVISDVPGLILGFNTPMHKVNVGANGEPFKNFNYSFNIRWVDSYLYFMPFAEGRIESFYTLDAQISYRVPSLNTTFRIGGTNITDQNAVQVYGSAPIGRILYAGATFDMNIFNRK